MQFSVQPVSVGFLIALIALILVLILMVTGQIPFLWVGVILCLLAVSRLC
jgi:hypothetical protein